MNFVRQNTNSPDHNTAVAQAFRDAEVRDRRLFEAAQEGILILDVDTGRINDANPFAVELLGVSPGEMSGKTLGELGAFKHIEPDPGLLERLQRDGYVRYEDLPLETRDGRIIAVELVCHICHAGDKRVIHCNLRDIAGRKQAEMDSNRLAAIIEFSDDAILSKNLDGLITSWNKGAEKIFGYTAGEMVGTPIVRLIPADRQEEEDHILEKIKRGENVEHFETLRQAKDGRLIDVSVTASPIKDASGKIVGVSKVSRDISERKMAEEAMRASAARYRTLFDYAPDGLVIADAESRYLDANASACRMLGYARDELIGMHARDIVVQSEIQHIQPALDAIKDGSDYHREWQFRRKDGSFFTAEVLATMMPDGNLLGVLRDISERRRTEDELKASLKEIGDLKAALDEHAIVAITDPQGRITYVNDKFCAISKYSREELLGQDHRLINSGFHPKEFIRELWRTITHGRVWHGEIKNKAKDGSYYWVDTTIVPFLNENGKPRQYVAIRADITERMAAVEKIRQFNNELEQRVAERTVQLQAANQELEAFSYSVSHDLRAPLRHVAGFVELLQKDAVTALSEKSLRHLTTISEAAKRMGDLIDDLLAFSRVGRATLQKADVNLDTLVQETLGDFQAETRARNIQWNIHPLPTVCADRALLRLVLVNLISNAVKFTGTRAEARIEIGCASDADGETVIFIRDNGAGFDPRYVGKLFGVFQRLHSEREFAGTGIGLANVQRIIHRHGGRTWAEGLVDGGATFYFSIPKPNGGSHEH